MRSNKNIVLRSWVKTFTVVIVLLCSQGVEAQLSQIALNGMGTDSAQAQTIMILVRSSAIVQIRHAFDSIRAFVPANRINMQALQWADSKAITQALDIRGLTISSLKPFVAQHSAAIEDLREHMNSELFSAERTSGVPVQKDLANLSAAETRIARWFVLAYKNRLSPQSATTLLRRSSKIEFAEPRMLRRTCYIPNDPLFPQQFGPQVINAPKAWDLVRCDSSIVIADVDIGTDWTHEDLTDAIFLNQGEIGLDSNGLDKRSNGVDDDGNGFVDDWHGWDFCGGDGLSPDNDTRNPNAGHGTHTAGIAAATGDNGKGIAGIGFGSKLIPIKCASDQDPGNLYFTSEALIYAADMGARAVNCSWGGPTYSQAEQDVVNYVTLKGLTVVAAAGNNDHFQEFYPASYQHVLSVGAIESDSTFAGDSIGNPTSTIYSNHSIHLAVCAPGTNVLSTLPGNIYADQTGTSMACPHATGSLALLMKRFPNYNSQQAAQQLRVTCAPIPNNPFPDFTGGGRIDLFNAVTSTFTHAARLDSFEVLVKNADPILFPGVTANLVLHVKNYLGALNNLQARIEYQCSSDVISSAPPLLTFGKVATLGVVTNNAADFPLTVAPQAADTIVLVKVTFFDTTVGYTSDVDYFSIAINPLWRDLNKNNLTVTFDQHGAVGYGDEQNNTEGDGFTWSVPPPGVETFDNNVVYAAGLMISLDSNRVVSNAPGMPAGVNDTDFTATAPIISRMPPDHSNAVQELVSNYSDTNADPYVQAGVSVDEKAYAFDQNLAANAVVINYVLKKRQSALNQPATDSATVAFYADWDIGFSGSDNVATFDSTTMSSVTYRIDPTYPWVGVTLLSKFPPGAQLQYYADLNDGSDGSVNTYSGLSRQNKRWMMTNPKRFAGPGDVSIVYGLKNVPMLSQDSIVFTIAIVLASGAEALASTINDTRLAWIGQEDVNASPLSSPDELITYPNPFRDALHARLQTTSTGFALSATLYDVLGRAVRQYTSAGGYSFDLNTTNLPSGIYHLVAHQGSTSFSRSLIHIN
jgi:hypothetical protein